jgi:hypothetical protein
MAHDAQNTDIPQVSIAYRPLRANKALRKRIEADLTQIKRCQRGEHSMQATQSAGMVVCIRCLTIGVCLWCGVIPPHGACIITCPAHAELATRHAAMASTTHIQGKEENHVSHCSTHHR